MDIFKTIEMISNDQSVAPWIKEAVNTPKEQAENVLRQLKIVKLILSHHASNMKQVEYLRDFYEQKQVA